MTAEEYDILIVGAGPAGLTAGANTAARGLKTLIIEAKETYGGQPNTIYPLKTVYDLPGFPQGVLGRQFCTYLYEQAKSAGAEIVFNERIAKMKLEGEPKELESESGKVYRGKRVILCSGHLSVPRKLPQLQGVNAQGISYILRKPEDYKGRRVLVIGGGNTAVDNAFQLRQAGAEVVLIHRRDMLRTKEIMKERMEEAGVRILFNTELKEPIVKEGKVTGARVVNNKTKQEENIDADAILVNIGYELAPKNLDLSMFEQNEDKSIKVDRNQETSIKGVFAAGDITGEVKLIAVACAEGIVAAVHTFESIKKPYWL
ncbi:NAD(P)/FAD-dependent oxidoreductase [Candidatus Woesearchaeota archaeon]|nr:MAG: NAD(P)/FAD-dependent oxidoreductase [Candidatus Woesearchaeota archaeon]